MILGEGVDQRYSAMSQTGMCPLLILTYITIVNTQHLTGSIDDQHKQQSLLFKDLYHCVGKTNNASPHQRYRDVYLCVDTLISSCILKQRDYKSATMFSATHKSYCGSLWLEGNTLITAEKEIQLQITALPKMYLKILLFKFPRSRNVLCSQHGLTLAYLKFKKENYCGIRVPWLFIVQQKQVSLNLVLTRYHSYSLSLFYQGVQLNWIRKLTKVTMLFGTDKSSIYTPVMTNMYKMHTDWWFNYYLITRTYTVLRIHASWNRSSTFIVHDGPGPLANIIFNGADDIYVNNHIIQTSAFSAFLKIKIMVFGEISQLYFRIKSLRGVRLTSNCGTSKFGSIISRVPLKQKNTACFYEVKHHRKGAIYINIQSFLFSGPNTITDLSSSMCQYGGLVIVINYRNEIEICENVTNLKIFGSRDWIIIYFVWFSGYSEGNIVATLSTTMCKTVYGELLPPGSTFHQYITSYYKSATGCTIYICSPFRRCVIEVGPSEIGTAKITVKIVDTISPCGLVHHNENYKNTSMYSRKAVFSDAWPFSLSTNISYKHYWINNTRIERFVYLHSIAYIFPPICKSLAYKRRQMSVKVETSICNVTNEGDMMFNIVNNIPTLTDQCVTYIFTPVPRNKIANKNYHHFFYNTHQAGTNDHAVFVGYGECTMKCKRYQYSTFVRREDRKTIFEYRSNVGNFTFTGSNHTGFKVSIIIPDPVCKCRLHLFTEKTSRIFNDRKTSGLDALQFHPKRYNRHHLNIHHYYYSL